MPKQQIVSMALYCQKPTGDYPISSSTINSNRFANLGVDSSLGIKGRSMMNCHMGSAPYGIFQELKTGASRTFLADCSFYQTHFEAIGNGHLSSEANSLVAGPSNFRDTLLFEPGFSWSAISRIMHLQSKWSTLCRMYG